MAEVLQLSDGSIHTVNDIKDMLELIDTHLGYEACRWLEGYFSRRASMFGVPWVQIALE